MNSTMKKLEVASLKRFRIALLTGKKVGFHLVTASKEIFEGNVQKLDFSTETGELKSIRFTCESMRRLDAHKRVIGECPDCCLPFESTSFLAEEINSDQIKIQCNEEIVDIFVSNGA